MRTLWILALGVCLLPGCFIDDDDDDHQGTYYCGDRSIDPPFETCDDGNALDGDGCSSTCQTEYEPQNTFITASWSLKKFADNGIVPCPPGYDTAAIYSQPINGDGTSTGMPYVDLYDCSAQIGTTAPLPGSQYLSWVEIANYSNTQTYAKSLSATVDTRQGDQTATFNIFVDAGFFQFAWTLVGANSSSTLTCAQAGATGAIEIVATDVNNSTNANTDFYTCDDGTAVTDPFLAGTYTVSVKATDSNDAVVGSAATLTNKVIQSPNLVTNLGTVTIPITGH
ncbi:MAG TPA: hypothetical protein VL326_30180 [Kofleriaceae bacterium]|nr:hypothetical protein [Kofleriaceae bacterium]